MLCFLDSSATGIGIGRPQQVSNIVKLIASGIFMNSVATLLQEWLVVAQGSRLIGGICRLFRAITTPATIQNDSSARQDAAIS